MWEVDQSGLAVHGRAGAWQVGPYVRTMGSHRELREYLQRHGLERTFPTRARAVDALRLALSEEPLSRPRARTRWQRESEGSYRSRDRRWRLQREPGGSLLTPLHPELKEAVEARPELRRMLRRDCDWTLDAHAEWLDRIERFLSEPPGRRRDSPR